jgi:flagellar biosynthetic protein FlhB
MDQRGEKTEQATPRRLEEAWKKGQFARSSEVQTVFVLFGGMLALLFAGHETWRNLGLAMSGALGHLHDMPIRSDGMQKFFIDAFGLLGACVWPVLVATAVAGLLAGGIQSRFHTASEALEVNWERVNPVHGWRRVFSWRSAVPTGIAFFKFIVVIALAWNVIQSILSDPIFYTAVDVARIAQFMADSSFKIVMRVGFALVVLAAVDYGFQLWRTNEDLKMSKEEVKEEMKSQEGDPKVKARQRRRRQRASVRKMLAEVPKADVIVTNPTHLAIALRYDRKTMAAPKIVAKGSRLNALRIREIAQQHQIPVLENKPLARLMFKYGKVGGEIPAQLYVAVAEILAYVYRINAYRYYREQHLPT